ncbi:hypothetical protein OBBRIDRAFT_153086 [Obba rivulosa]|uniref:Uncharacterized protein n=1 Tax=Obba rivulosa TaxID=1052685 RepID=A0A8E2AVN6_9APHY|nr:hypothetical protein OBBRIDRAFT_153086 [Obba rivulosa]
MHITSRMNIIFTIFQISVGSILAIVSPQRSAGKRDRIAARSLSPLRTLLRLVHELTSELSCISCGGANLENFPVACLIRFYHWKRVALKESYLGVSRIL